MISIVIPCYNEDSRGSGEFSLLARLNLLDKTLNDLKMPYELIFVDDASTDNTFNVLINYISNNHSERWSILRHNVNKGKGEALITGFRVCRGDYIAYLDADLSTSPSYFLILEDRLDESTCYIASRYCKESKIKYSRSLIRRAVSKFARSFLPFLFGLDVYDTQCGFKIFPAKMITSSLSTIVGSRWLLDIELLYLAKVNNIEISEFPIEWNNMESESTLNIRSGLLNSFRDLFLILNIKKELRNHSSE